MGTIAWIGVWIMKRAWKGYWVASPTPFFENGQIDENGLTDLMELYVSQGVHGIVVNGSTGEWCSQSTEERIHIAHLAVSQVGNRVPVIVGISTYTPEQSLELARSALTSGADGVMLTPPPYYHLRDDEIFDFYNYINSHISLPIMVYNWPRGVVTDMSEDLMVSLARLTNVQGIKESSGDETKTYRVFERLKREESPVSFFARFIHPTGMKFLTDVGGDGNIDGGGLGVGFAVGFYEAFWRGQSDEMKKFSDSYTRLSQQLITSDYSGIYASPISQLKASMRILQQPGGYVRPPLRELRDAERLEEISGILRVAGLSDPVAKI